MEFLEKSKEGQARDSRASFHAMVLSPSSGVGSDEDALEQGKAGIISCSTPAASGASELVPYELFPDVSAGRRLQAWQNEMLDRHRHWRVVQAYLDLSPAVQTCVTTGVVLSLIMTAFVAGRRAMSIMSLRPKSKLMARELRARASYDDWNNAWSSESGHPSMY